MMFCHFIFCIFGCKFAKFHFDRVAFGPLAKKIYPGHYVFSFLWIHVQLEKCLYLFFYQELVDDVLSLYFQYLRLQAGKISV